MKRERAGRAQVFMWHKLPNEHLDGVTSEANVCRCFSVVLTQSQRGVAGRSLSVTVVCWHKPNISCMVLNINCGRAAPAAQAEPAKRRSTELKVSSPHRSEPYEQASCRQEVLASL